MRVIAKIGCERSCSYIVRCTIPFFSKRDNLQWTERLHFSRPSMKESAQIWS
jgi:hypothetical protein